MKRLAVGLLLFFFSTPALAGYFEFGTSFNYRRSTIDTDNYQETTSYTGSVSYFFWAMSAIEVSYTNGDSLLSYRLPDESPILMQTKFSMIGVDFVITLAEKTSAFIPYVKVGGVQVTREIIRKAEGFPASTVGGEESGGVAPSAGIGFKTKLTKSFALKVGLDAWTTPIDKDPVTIDYAGRAGISWMF